MTNVDPSTNAGLAPPPTKSSDGRTMLGHVVVCTGHAEGEEVIAVWHVNTVGSNVGAWVIPFDLGRPDRTSAVNVLNLCLRRAIVGWDPSRALAIRRTLEEAAKVDSLPWSESVLILPELLNDISLIRRGYEKQTVDEQKIKRNITSIEWPVSLPEHIPATAERLLQHIGLTLPDTSPAASEALLESNLLGWAVQRWQETMTTLRRRHCLRRRFGQPSHLPLPWETRLTTAYARNRLTPRPLGKS